MVILKLFFSFLIIGFTSFGGMSMISLINDLMLSNGFMTVEEVADIVAIAEMTPGPLGVNCATFAGARTAGMLGAAAATLGVLVPTMTTTLMAAIFLKKFRESKGLSMALFGIRPVCIGMIASVAVQQSMTNYAGTMLFGISLPSIFIGVVAMVLLLKLRWDVPRTILVSAVLGLILCR